MDIDEVKKYLCMKNMQNPDKCPGCASLSTCTAGQRVMVLMAEKQKRENPEKDSTKQGNYNDMRRERAIAYVKAVISSGDPREYLMQHEGISKGQATKKLDNWRQRYPELMRDVTCKKHHNGINKYTSEDAIREYEASQRKLFETICQQDDMTEWVLQNGNVSSRTSARAKMLKLSRKFPDIAEQYGFMERYKNGKLTSGWNARKTNDGGNAMEHQDAGKISVAEFLKSMEAEPETEEINAVQEPEVASGHNACGIPNELTEKQNQIGAEMDRVSQEIKKLQDYYNSLKRANDAVSMTMHMIGMKITDKNMADMFRYYK